MTPAELHDAGLAAAADRYTMNELGVPSLVLMERASLCVAHEIHELLVADAVPVWILVGPGNNGGDGLCVARILRGWGHEVTAVLTTERRNDMAQHQLEVARALGVPVIEGLVSDAPRRAVIVDAMLGTGSTGAPRGGVARALQWQAGIAGTRVAIDVPSGVEVDTGALHVDAFVADVTVTFVRSKVGLHVTPGRQAAGRVVVADIGIVEDPGREPTRYLVAPLAVADRLRALRPAPHKNARGHIAVVGGGAGTPGAPILTATGAMRAGAGLATIVSSSAKLRRELIEWRPELMVASYEGGRVHPRADTLVVGPGLTDRDETVDLGALYREDDRPAVWDASALNELPFERPGGPRVLTPHPGEAARMLDRAQPDVGWDTGGVQAKRLDAASALARHTEAIVVLKGAGTIVAEPRGRQYVAVAGSSALATAGSGDVLAGIIAGLLGRGLDPTEAATIGVHLHGVAGDLAAARRPSPLASDIAEAIPEAMRRCRAGVPPISGWPSFRRG